MTAASVHRMRNSSKQTACSAPESAANSLRESDIVAKVLVRGLLDIMFLLGGQFRPLSVTVRSGSL